MCRLEENKDIAKYLFLQFVYKTVLQKFQKNMQKIPDAVWKRGNDTYLWEKGK